MEEEYIKISGTVEKIIFCNEDSGYAVLEMLCGQDEIIAVGQLSEANEGEELDLTGRYGTHPSFGLQFKTICYEKRLPATAGAILKYLSSGAVRGIGPVTARRIVDEFGDESLEIAYKDPTQLTRIKGITAKKAAEIGEEMAKNFTMRDLLAFLGAFGIAPTYAMYAYRTFGTDALSAISQNPFLLCNREIGLPFGTADQMAGEMGVEGDNRLRISAGIDHVFAANQSNGHTCLPKDKLVAASAKLLAVETALVELVLDGMVENRELISVELEGKNYIFPPDLYSAQQFIANRLAQMHMLLRTAAPKNVDEMVKNIEQELGITYAQRQRDAMEYALTEGVFVLTGGPGTGKTTTLKGILCLLEATGHAVALAAPTGRAAQRMNEVTGRPAQTLHRLLEASGAERRGGFQRNMANPLKEDTIIVDEVSMVDTRLMEALLLAMKPTARLILVGDSNQLPSIGPGNLLGDFIGSGCFPCVELDTIFRQAAESLIVVNAHSIVKGEMPDLTARQKDFFFLRGDVSGVTGSIGDLVEQRLPKAYGYCPVRDIQVITPSRKGELGTENLNTLLQARLNPPAKNKYEVRFMGTTYRCGDKVMQVKNNYDLLYVKDGEPGGGIFNGDIGVITDVQPHGETITIDFDGKVCEYPLGMLSELELAYAITVHKSQGSEFRAVIFPVQGGGGRLYFRNLLYTGVTRAKELLVMMGNEAGVAAMVGNNRRTMRYTLMKTMIKQECGM